MNKNKKDKNSWNKEQKKLFLKPSRVKKRKK
ncbi:hypothetical protein GvMRE_I2g326 [endosymbiont GvMRE of Glomus versiforme]|nr:hypothetical protein GvMRE_I2g326 [endosymbiont GvMRE of Glomus versiforme]